MPLNVQYTILNCISAAVSSHFPAMANVHQLRQLLGKWKRPGKDSAHAGHSTHEFLSGCS